MPRPAGGAAGGCAPDAGAPGACWPEAGGVAAGRSNSEPGAVDPDASKVNSRLVAKNAAARLAVTRVRKLAAPRPVMKPPPPPMPSAPPSERCSSTTPTSAAAIKRWRMSKTVVMKSFLAGVSGLLAGLLHQTRPGRQSAQMRPKRLFHVGTSLLRLRLLVGKGIGARLDRRAIGIVGFLLRLGFLGGRWLFLGWSRAGLGLRCGVGRWCGGLLHHRLFLARVFLDDLLLRRLRGLCGLRTGLMCRRVGIGGVLGQVDQRLALAAEQELLIHLEQPADLLELGWLQVGFGPLRPFGHVAARAGLLQLPLLGLEVGAAVLVERSAAGRGQLQQKGGNE